MDVVGKYNKYEYTYRHTKTKIAIAVKNCYRTFDNFIFHPESGEFELVNLSSAACEVSDIVSGRYYVGDAYITDADFY
jgi:hypothetical protein